MNNWKENSLSESSRFSDKPSINKPLDGILVIDFSQFLSGPSAGLRLADLGARVIKIERPETGDICRTLYVSNVELDGDSTIFHAINRNKEGFAADLKKTEDVQKIKQLIAKADCIIQNFRPGVMKKLGFDYQTVKEYNPGIIYAEVSGYGTEGPWKDTPGQDLLVQSRSGLTWLSGDENPSPMGLSIVDMAAGVHLAQGILAALVRKSVSGQGAFIEVSLLESILDMQFERLSVYLNKQIKTFKTSIEGIYRTSDGSIAMADVSLKAIGELLEIPVNILEASEIKTILSNYLKIKPTKEWLELLESAGISCSEVFSWDQLFEHEGFKRLEMIQEVKRANGLVMKTTRCPIRIDGKIYKVEKGSPKIGEDTFQIENEFNLR